MPTSFLTRMQAWPRVLHTSSRALQVLFTGTLDVHKPCVDHAFIAVQQTDWVQCRVVVTKLAPVSMASPSPWYDVAAHLEATHIQHTYSLALSQCCIGSRRRGLVPVLAT